MGFSTPPGHRNPTYDSDTDGFIDQTKGVNVPDYEEDPNSFFSVLNGPSLTCTLAEPANNLLILSSPGRAGFTEMQVNGTTTTSYSVVDNSDTVTRGRDSFRVPPGERRTELRLHATPSGVAMTAQSGEDTSNQPVAGRTTDASPPITQFTLRLASGGFSNAKVRVYAITV